MAKILITGATGFIGRSLVPALLSEGHDVRCAVLQLDSTLQAEQIVINNLEVHTDWTDALRNVEIVIHLAARVHIMKEYATSSLDEYCKINSIATKNFVEQAVQNNVKRFIFLSTIKVHGEFSQNNLPFSEDCRTQPEDPYAKSKLYAEQFIQEICQNARMEFVILRPPLVYGPYVKANFLRILQLVDKKWPLPFGSIYNKRTFIYIDNLVSAISAVVSEPSAANQVYLVADDCSWSLTQLVQTLSRKMNTKLFLIPIPVQILIFLFKLCGLKNINTRLFSSLEVSNEKIKSQLGWTPPVSSIDGLEKTVKWYQNEYNT
ncbi:TPA: NAD-dependent epimerase/dehydratase family protein [Legionella pneumophila]|uniref:NAD dependent epimerase/dehydratase, UDP-glucose-4-epimerase n=12 Tax=Legionella pneumophila TaxID=446 RepID=Q5ZXH0_LEGPH|nr:NAD-dependent epimerase/dehydratase family protein [Legionella pneumophila]ERH44907.1 NAD dependent epimerase/dehydratase [Legionella pneumophila str. Leg01/11]ERH44976.1 NAD dependent epimerase/dehydratase [Legionella pneumophila str. Leg01/53]ERI48934.1 NAD dependent epimerase/dehydratase [Legionella pneumophila str. Leg01/20]WBV62525.1 NAD-dependent epimerase/dehydratase family protein [Legionella pneumophila 130b]AAU26850.1 NAD dependent epimerase/dehydratase, UDP-glucose-4-epimerase [L